VRLPASREIISKEIYTPDRKQLAKGEDDSKKL
jgi:hypothetical protein